MYGQTPEDAVQYFLDTISQSLGCVTDEVINVFGGYRPAVQPHRLILNNSPVRLAGPSQLSLKVLHLYRVVEDPTPLGPWRITTAAYYYSLDGPDGREIVAYHWHPRQDTRITTPHLHLRSGVQVRREEFQKVHFPTGRIALEDVLRMAITELGVLPRRDGWERVLAQTQSAFEAARRWPQSGLQ